MKDPEQNPYIRRHLKQNLQCRYIERRQNGGRRRNPESRERREWQVETKRQAGRNEKRRIPTKPERENAAAQNAENQKLVIYARNLLSG